MESNTEIHKLYISYKFQKIGMVIQIVSKNLHSTCT